ncbi:hypothetical protein [Anaeromyxobacter dehalogenans]|uniref:hypothetical protein n=1 Tax=Anaeromyxobacter dehalogenans TaxID=161493 RepID=UPI0012ECD9E7|nr:hypothetical protein [Anaeromyxobacter dehalogenans]
MPEALRAPLLEALRTIIRNYRESRWEPAELNGGKLCEVTISILQGFVAGSYPPAPSKPPNMVAACLALEKAGDKVPRSVRIQIPRVLTALYEIRNNRGVGHVGGDVNPNHMDAVFVLMTAKWIVAELIRLFHGVDTATAAAAVDALVDRTLPIVWEVGGKKRVLLSGLTALEKTLVLLYSTPGGISESVLADWIGHWRASVYRRDVLVPAHRRALVDYDRSTGVVVLSPTGERYVEENIPLEI